MLAMATVTAGLMWPPDTPPLTNIPRITPIAHLEKTQSQNLYKRLTIVQRSLSLT